MIKERPKVIIGKAKQLNLYSIPPVKLWATGTKMRRTFGGGTPNVADLVTDYLTKNDNQYMIGTKKTMGGNSTYYHLAPILKLYAEVEIRVKGALSSVYNPDNFSTEMRFHTINQLHIKNIVNGINQLWDASGKGPMLNNMNYKRYQKKLKVTPEEIQQAWQAWSDTKQTLPSTTISPSTSYPPGPLCPNCNKPTTFIPQYNRYYCYPCQKYI
ncbi:MAG: hypothetical protein ACFFD2_13000 [Promethearchaeota archaeon]